MVEKGNKRIEMPRWTLYTALRYDRNLLSKYKNAIYKDDARKIQEWIIEVKKRTKNKS